tara:strand:+ start:1993 stop:2244 length:252 start_codon:yes stop_codon:yes gene_type:complete
MSSPCALMDTFCRRLKKIGIFVELSGNVPWVYLRKVNGIPVKGLFYANHGFTAFMYPVRLGSKVRFTDRRRVFEKIRDMIENE